MKNEKFCFSKGTGLIALVGIVLVAAALLMGSVSNTSTSTSTKAAFGCPNGSVPAGSFLCPKILEAVGYDGKPVTEWFMGAERRCCYRPMLFNPFCPDGSSPDYFNSCPTKKIVTGKKAKYIATGKEINCCNWLDLSASNNGPQGNPVVSTAPVVSPPEPTSIQKADYCSKLKLFSISSTVFEEGYRNTQCNADANNAPQWNGMYGTAFAKCYTRTGVCARSANCDGAACLATVDGYTGCVNREVEMSLCMQPFRNKAGKTIAAAAPSNALGEMTCPEDGKKIYLNAGNGTYYLQGGTTCTSKDPKGEYVGSQPYCCNALVDSNVVSDLKRSGVIKTAAVKDCILETPVYGWGDWMTIVKYADFKFTTKTQKMCLQTNASNGTTCTAFKEVPIELCQCNDLGGINKKSKTYKTASVQTICTRAYALKP